MSAFDATIRLGDIHVEVPEEDENGKKYQANLVMGVLALAQVGPQQLLPIPLGALRAPVDKRTIASLIKGLQEAHDQLEMPSDLTIASDLSAVEQAIGGQPR